MPLELSTGVGEDEMGNRLLWLSGKVINLIYSNNVTSANRNSLINRVDDWYTRTTETVRGISYGGSDEEGLQKLFFAIPAAGKLAWMIGNPTLDRRIAFLSVISLPRSDYTILGGRKLDRNSNSISYNRVLSAASISRKPSDPFTSRRGETNAPGLEKAHKTQEENLQTCQSLIQSYRETGNDLNRLARALAVEILTPVLAFPLVGKGS
ncbi:hypothetical protein GQX73_g3433 [Xylaria multiplex]|uniref:Uncharacterized protein n=1 Tax=Xylaria multiplex TaxID=323545 RepID=A0A7C8IVI5_9PEZI|nr:hypothetical protein GQX73_g3433 [Xylaria multiplex]